MEATGQKKTLPAWIMPSTGSSICGFDFDALDDTYDYKTIKDGDISP